MENLSKKAPYRSGHYGGAKSVYDDVFAAPPRFGVPSLSPRIEDYAEIFGGLRGSHRVSTSIPMLDLPAADVAEVAVSFRGSRFDYLEVFGGSEGLEFVVYEELMERSKGGDYDSSDEAWTPAQSETMSEESEPFACTDRYQTKTNAESHNSTLGTIQFKVSYNKVFHTSEDDVANGLSRVAQLNEVPGYSFLVHETRPPQKMVVANNLKHEDFSGEIREGKQFKKSTSLPNKPFVTVSDISLKTQPSHLPPPSRPPPSLGSKDGDSDTQSLKMKASRSFAFGETTSDDDSPLFYDVEVDASSSAAVSAAEMKAVMEKAQAKLKSAKHIKERSKQAKIRGETSERDFDGGKGLAENGRNCGKGLEKSALKNDGNVEWKQDEEFFEVIEAEDSRNLLDVIDDQSFVEHNLQNIELRREKRESHAISHENVVSRKMTSGSEIHEKIIVEAVKGKDSENMANVWEKESEAEKRYKNFEIEENGVRLRGDAERESYEKRLKETLEREEKEKIEREFQEREEKEKQEIEARERDLDEKRLREAIEKEEKEKRLRLALEEKEKKQREAWEKEEKEKREKEAREIELEEKRLREAIGREEKEKRLRLAIEEKEKKQREAQEREEKEKKEKESRERELEEKRLREAIEREEKEKRLRLALQLKEKKEREAREREEKEKREKEARERELEEKRIKESIEKEENEKRLRLALEEKEKKHREARERVEKEAKEKEARLREEKEKREKEARERESEEKRLQKVLEEKEKKQKDAREREEKEKREKEECERELEEKRLREALEQEEKENELKIALEKEKNEKKLKVNISEEPNITLQKGEHKEKDSDLKEDNEKRSKEAFDFEHENIDKMWEEINGLDENVKFCEAVNKMDKKSVEKNKKSKVTVSKFKDSLPMHDTVFEFEKIPSKKSANFAKPNVVDCDLGEISANTDKYLVAKGKKEEKVTSSQEVKAKVQSQNAERKGKNLDDVLSREEKQGEERMSREREMENERLRKIEEEREREREREKDRMAVNMTSLERAAAERANVDARQRLEKENAEARMRVERAAVERATAEARERAFQKAKAEKAAFETRERAERMRQSSLQSDSFQSAGSTNGSMNTYSSVHGGVEVESAQRCKARLERHQRTAQRAAKALEEKNQRDLLAQRELAERNRLAEGLDAEVKRWSSGKESNLRALLSTLQYILGPDSGWQPIHLTEVITSAAVKRAYRKATLCVHPDKLQQRGASIHQKYICEKVFDLLKAAWNKFNSEER